MIKKTNYITPNGHQRLVDELNQLLKVERPEITKLIQWAASNGDRSENADYLYGRKRLREIDRRLRFLNSRINEAVIIDPLQTKSNKVQFGATVTVSDEEGNEKSYSIVGIDEVDTSKGYLSWKSPIGSALLTKEEGDEVVIRTPQGEIVFEIISIEYKALD
ncbi:MAG TPA: transcription elongation factor GreB [Bacteriovoracaceae bacterium]|nr:transcription elongation factor GreB [Bacteriovoracaceae bacterium]